jgi:very-short-patch-repair endonuclease
MNYSNHPVTKEFRQLQRKYPTPAEHRLWTRLRNRQVDGYKFRRQHGFGPYIMDFYCPQLRLCIEVDGSIHDTQECTIKDADRTAFLNENRIVVIRFTNEEIETTIDNVIERIKEIIKDRLS